MTRLLLAVGHAWGRGHALLNRVSVIETMNGARTGREETLIGLFSPSNRTYDLVSPDRTVRLLRLASEVETIPSVALAPAVQGDTELRWEDVPFALWSRERFKAERIVDLGGAVVVRLGADLAGWVRNETTHELDACRITRGNQYVELGRLPPGSRLALRPEAWQRRTLPAASLAPGSVPQAAVSSDPYVAIRDEISLMASAGSPGTGGMAILTARAPSLPLRLEVVGLPGQDRAAVLLVRVPVPPGRARAAEPGAAPSLVPGPPVPPRFEPTRRGTPVAPPRPRL
jgi:hypothetical protein